MTGTAYNFSQIQPYSLRQPEYSPGFEYEIPFEYTIGATVVVGDTYTTPANALPSGIRIIETALTFTPNDTNSSPTGTLSVGDSGSSTRFINAGNSGSSVSGAQLGLSINQVQALTNGVVSAGCGYLYGTSSTAPQLIVTVGGTLATAASTGYIRLKIRFRCTGEN